MGFIHNFKYARDPKAVVLLAPKRMQDFIGLNNEIAMAVSRLLERLNQPSHS